MSKMGQEFQRRLDSVNIEIRHCNTCGCQITWPLEMKCSNCGRLVIGQNCKEDASRISPYTLPSDAYDKYFTPLDGNMTRTNKEE